MDAVTGKDPERFPEECSVKRCSWIYRKLRDLMDRGEVERKKGSLINICSRQAMHWMGAK